MIHASDYLERNTEGFVIHNNKVVAVTVSSVEDISRHGSSCYIIRFKELPRETFSSMYSLSEEGEAKRDLSIILQKKINSIKKKRKELKTEIKMLKSNIKSLREISITTNDYHYKETKCNLNPHSK